MDAGRVQPRCYPVSMAVAQLLTRKQGTRAPLARRAHWILEQAPDLEQASADDLFSVREATNVPSEPAEVGEQVLARVRQPTGAPAAETVGTLSLPDGTGLGH